MSEENNNLASKMDELEQLRKILYGDYAQDTSLKLEDLNSRLAEFRMELMTALKDQDDGQSNQLETTRQTLEDKISQLTYDMNERFDKLEANMNKQFAMMDDKKANRRDLGRMLVELGTFLQKEK